MYAKHYENPTMLSKVTAKNVGDVFLRHTVVQLTLIGSPLGYAFSSEPQMNIVGCP